MLLNIPTLGEFLSIAFLSGIAKAALATGAVYVLFPDIMRIAGEGTRRVGEIRGTGVIRSSVYAESKAATRRQCCALGPWQR
jgi:hypothetical protein